MAHLKSYNEDNGGKLEPTTSFKGSVWTWMPCGLNTVFVDESLEKFLSFCLSPARYFLKEINTV